jgi:hypothetical protein
MPIDPSASELLEVWLSDPETAGFDGTYADFRGADLSDGVFVEAWLTGADLSGTALARVDFYRANFETAKLAGAVLAGSSLVRANLDEAVLAGADLSGTDLRGASIYGADARRANFSGSALNGTSFMKSDLRGASLSECIAKETSIDAVFDMHTDFHGFRGTVVGECQVESAGQRNPLAGEQLQNWLNSRGASVTVLELKKTKKQTDAPQR